jgi:hypothetical protein
MRLPSLVGHTASNKPIYQYDTSDPKDLDEKVHGFNQEDHFEAAAVFSYLQFAYWRKYGENSHDYIDASAMFYKHESMIKGASLVQYASALGLITAFDRSKYGRKLCVPHLQEILVT